MVVNRVYFICPICNERLYKESNSIKCKNSHSFDYSKSGYVNLLKTKGRAKIHGDGKVMIKSRKRFLDGGYYQSLQNMVSEFVVKYLPENGTVLDCGCGEGYYSAEISRRLCEKKSHFSYYGIDISKDAVNAGMKRCKHLDLAVASVFNIPVEEKSVDLLLTIFAPFCADECRRVIKDNGYLIMVIPLENHLWGLKCAVYDNPYRNQVESLGIAGFELVEKAEIIDWITLESNETVKDLFSMTPYYYKTSRSDFKKLDSIRHLETEIEFGILVYKKDKC
ncbi:MAG: methyltransferase domain-containing protein [Clostridiales bacterium]|nr:methyltransferase domain-containing protein [Clostridiales bacterium]